jgi:hypothetical protein
MEFPYIALGATFNQARMEQATEPISVQPRVQIMQMRMTRIVAERMRAVLGQPIIIDNVGGAAGRIGHRPRRPRGA